MCTCVGSSPTSVRWARATAGIGGLTEDRSARGVAAGCGEFLRGDRVVRTNAQARLVYRRACAFIDSGVGYAGGAARSSALSDTECDLGISVLVARYWSHGIGRTIGRKLGTPNLQFPDLPDYGNPMTAASTKLVDFGGSARILLWVSSCVRSRRPDSRLTQADGCSGSRRYCSQAATEGDRGRCAHHRHRLKAAILCEHPSNHPVAATEAP